ncbi:MAG: histone deacetylase [Anaerolineales bacterium]|nr:histone deacetylase [Anaerolineales bacterium]
MSAAIVSVPAPEHDHEDHPENARRLPAIEKAIHATGLHGRLTHLAARPATDEELTRVHPASYVAALERAMAHAPGYLDHAPTYFTSASFASARLAAGGALRAVDAVLAGEADTAFALVRPPGHHCLPDQAMGFCLFSNAALAARHLQARGLQRILIVDFDVHHGNGTQAAFYADPSVLFISTHQQGIYPLSGAEDETGAADGQGATINVPVPAGAGDRAFARILETLIAPAAARFQPDFLLVSAGYDAHWRDPLAALQLSTTGYFQLVRGLRALAQAQCAGRLALILEGGYDPHALADSVAASLHALLGEDSAPDPLGGAPYPEPLARVEAALYRLRARHAL